MSSAGQAAPPGAPVLISTKLHVPRMRSGMVSRPRLVARLVGGRERKLALLCAPAGWGKTTLLIEWLASPDEPRECAWVSLDAADGDPGRFWSYVIGALRAVRPDVGEGALAALPAAGAAVNDTVVPLLVNDLAAVDEPLVLVLDDYHLVRGAAVHDSVAFLLRRLPAGVQLAVASRADPPLPLAALRAARDMVEIRAAELRFSEDEAAELLNDSLGLGLDASDVGSLHARTEGWAAGLGLAALSVERQADRRAGVEALTGEDRQISDYLHEVLAEQPAGLREFLLRTSILERFCASLCEAVTGDGNATEQLERVERSNLFLVPLDSRGEWYRYHHLFAELLRHELVRSSRDLVPELHRRASAWHREHGTAEEAIAHATAAGDHTEAADLIARHWMPIAVRGQRETVAAWIDRLPQEVVLGDARLCLARGWLLLILGAFDEVEPWVLAAESGPLPGPLYHPSPRASIAASAALLRSGGAGFGGDVGRAIEHGRAALALDEDEASPTRGLSRLALAYGLYFAGEIAASEELLVEALRPRPQPEFAQTHVYILALLASTSLDRDDLAGAERLAAEAEGLVSERRLDEQPFVALVHVARGRLLERRAEAAGAAASFGRAVELARRGGRRLELAHALLLLARLKRRQRDYLAARSLVREAGNVLAACPDPGWLRDLLAKTERSLQLTAPRRRASGPPRDPDLSERELAVLRLLASDLSQREIGAELYISLNTVKFHIRNIFRKLGVSSRAEAVARGRELALL
jgi:LuxR family transcriptional regulator, maltose regulon positive regulatory protein